MKTLAHALLAASVIAGSIAATAGGASAYVACNARECWHTDSRWVRPGVAYHPDDWYFHRTWTGGPYAWRGEYHRERGYWRDGIWIKF